ncbi:hypothetical protein QYF36_023637 [Acer negundo]|nr:hypothetical protein QYF36_023637 [Acer negundo]
MWEWIFNKLVKPCDVCGSIGSAEKIVTCFRCEKARQHVIFYDQGALLCMILDILGDSGSVTGVDIARHRLAACRTLPQKLHPGSSLSSSSVGCSVSKCGNNSPRLIKPVFRGKSFIKKKVKQDPTSTSISSTQCYRSANNDLGPSTSNLDNYKRDCTVNKNERKENLKGSTASSITNTSIEVNSSVAETSSSKAVSFSDYKDICWNDCKCVGVTGSVITDVNVFDFIGCRLWYGPLKEIANGEEGTISYMIIPSPPASVKPELFQLNARITQTSTCPSTSKTSTKL